MTSLKKLAAIACIALFGASMMGCNTIKGFGRDVEKGGEGIQDVSEETRQEMREN
jgi:predicted small secreted protein